MSNEAKATTRQRRRVPLGQAGDKASGAEVGAVWGSPDGIRFHVIGNASLGPGAGDWNWDAMMYDEAAPIGCGGNDTAPRWVAYGRSDSTSNFHSSSTFG